MPVSLQKRLYPWPRWWPNPPAADGYYASYDVLAGQPFELETSERLVESCEGSDEFDSAYSWYLGEESKKRVRLGVYYNPDYDWYEVVP